MEGSFDVSKLEISKRFLCFWGGFLQKYKANFNSFGVVRRLDFVAIEWHQNHAITLSGWGVIA